MGLDARVHFETVSLVLLAARTAALRIPLAISYALTGPLVIVALLLPPLRGFVNASRRYVLGIVLAAILTAAAFAVWPAAGPWTTEGYAPTKEQAAVTAYIGPLNRRPRHPRHGRFGDRRFPVLPRVACHFDRRRARQHSMAADSGMGADRSGLHLNPHHGLALSRRCCWRDCAGHRYTLRGESSSSFSGRAERSAARRRGSADSRIVLMQTLNCNQPTSRRSFP